MPATRIGLFFALWQASRQGTRSQQRTTQAIVLKREIRLSKCFAEERKSFRGQLYESTAQRLERERAEQRRFANERGADRGGRTSALTFGLPPFPLGKD